MAKVLKRHGEKERFDERKLYASIYYPAREERYTEEDAEELAADVTEAIKDWMADHADNVLTAEEVRDKTIELLEERDEDVAFMYQTHLDLS